MTPVPHPPDGVDPDTWLTGWNVTIAAITSMGAAIVFVWRSISTWAERMTKSNVAQLERMEARVVQVEAEQHRTDLRIVALESLSREVERLGRTMDHGFDGISKQLDDFSKRCFVFHSRGGGGGAE